MVFAALADEFGEREVAPSEGVDLAAGNAADLVAGPFADGGLHDAPLQQDLGGCFFRSTCLANSLTESVSGSRPGWRHRP